MQTENTDAVTDAVADADTDAVAIADVDIISGLLQEMNNTVLRHSRILESLKTVEQSIKSEISVVYGGRLCDLNAVLEELHRDTLSRIEKGLPTNFTESLVSLFDVFLTQDSHMKID